MFFLSFHEKYILNIISSHFDCIASVQASAPSETLMLLKTSINRPNPGQSEKIKLNFYFHTSLWCLKRFYEDLKGLHKTF